MGQGATPPTPGGAPVMSRRFRISLELDDGFRCLQWSIDRYDERGDRVGTHVHSVGVGGAPAPEVLEDALDLVSSDVVQLRWE